MTMCIVSEDSVAFIVKSAQKPNFSWGGRQWEHNIVKINKEWASFHWCVDQSQYLFVHFDKRWYKTRIGDHSPWDYPLTSAGFAQHFTFHKRGLKPL